LIDWPELLAQHRIPFVTSGPNVNRGFVAIACPFCGAADPSQHMTLKLGGRTWACWRNREHRGTDRARLLAAVLRCSYSEARELSGETTAAPEDLLGQVQALLSPAAPQPDPAIAPPEDWRPLDDRPSARHFVAYLERRGFARPVVRQLTEQYGLRYCCNGRLAGRIVFPVEENGTLRGYTGRTIHASQRLRYLSEGRLTRHLLWQDQLATSRAPILALCEGPFDALKLAVLGGGRIAATCCFTATPSGEQIARLYRLAGRFRYRILLLDQGAVPAMLTSLDRLNLLGFQAATLPPGRKDPGDLTEVGELMATLRPVVGNFQAC